MVEVIPVVVAAHVMAAQWFPRSTWGPFVGECTGNGPGAPCDIQSFAPR
jgi:hypothetical protein